MPRRAPRPRGPAAAPRCDRPGRPARRGAPAPEPPRGRGPTSARSRRPCARPWPRARARPAKRRARTAGPIRLKLPTTEISRASSIGRRSTCDGPLTASPDRPVRLRSNIRQALYKRRRPDDHPSTNGSRPRCPLDDAFAFVADFANAAALGPGRRHAPCGRTRVRSASGARYRLGVRMGGRVVADGLRGHGLRAPAPRRADRARAAASRPSTRSGSPRTAGGTRIDYTADIRLVGLLRLARPVRRRRARARRPRRARRHAARARPPRDGGLTRRWTSRSSAPGSAAWRPPTRSARRPPGDRVRARARARRPRQDRRPSTAPAEPVEVDTGFIVYNERTYPRFVGLLDELGVETQPSDMSFGSPCRRVRGRVQLARRPRASFPTSAPPCRPAQWRMLADVRRFYRDARAVLDGPTPATATLGEWLDERRLRTPVPRPLPRARSPRPSGRPPPTGSIDFPVDYLLRFLDNHGLIGIGNAPRWRVVSGGSRAYVERLVAALPAGALRTGARRRRDRARPVRRDDRDARTRPRAVRRRVLATHADDALRLLADADAARAHASSAASSTRPTPSCCTPTSGSCRPTRGPGPRGTSAPATAGGPATR